MRTKILFFLILLSANVLAQKINEEQVPKDVLIGLETIYPDVKVKSWEMIDGNYYASIKIDGQSGKAEISPNGKWLSTKFPVGEKELPSSIIKYFYDNYPGFKIVISQNIEEPDDNNFYYLKIQKKGLNQDEDGELFFDLAGNLTKSTAPEIVKPDSKNESAKKDEFFEEDKPVKKSNKRIEKEEEIEEEADVKPIKKAKVAPTSKSVGSSKKSRKDEESDNSSNADVPGTVKKMFDKKFPRTEDVSWEQVDSNYVATFFFRINDQKAEFAPDGKLVSTTTIMDPKNIFRPLENYLIKKYKKYKIVKAEKILYDRMYQKLFPEKKLKNYYYVEISLKVKGSKVPQINKLWFDGVGAIDKVEEGYNEDEESNYDDSEDDSSSKHDKKFKNETEE